MNDDDPRAGFERIDLDFADGWAHVYVWRDNNGVLGINCKVSWEEGEEARMTASECRRLIAALSSAASFVEARS